MPATYIAHVSQFLMTVSEFHMPVAWPCYWNQTLYKGNVYVFNIILPSNALQSDDKSEAVLKSTNLEMK